jgi:hypothetical protein
MSRARLTILILVVLILLTFILYILSGSVGVSED